MCIFNIIVNTNCSLLTIHCSLINQPRHTEADAVEIPRVLTVEHSVEVELHAGVNGVVEAEVEVAFHLGVPLAVAGEVVVAFEECSEVIVDVEAKAEGEESVGDVRDTRPFRADIVAYVEPVGDIVLEEQVERGCRVRLHKAVGHAGERDGEVCHQGDLGHPFVAFKDLDLGADDERLHVVGPVTDSLVVEAAVRAVVLQPQFGELGDTEAQHCGGQ